MKNMWASGHKTYIMRLILTVLISVAYQQKKTFIKQHKLEECIVLSSFLSFNKPEIPKKNLKFVMSLERLLSVLLWSLTKRCPLRIRS